MKLLKLLFIVLLPCYNLTAQPPGYIYNSYINKAEIFITEGNYTEALKTYEAAFATTKINFAVDIYNACVCASKLKNTAKLLALSDKLAAKGVGEKFFSKHIFKDYSATADFKKIAAKAQKTKNENTFANKKYNEGLKEFIKLDSIYNKLRLTNYSDSYNLPDTLHTLFAKNTRNLVNYIAANGYYSESKTGAGTSNDTIIKYMAKPDIVFLHYLEMGSDTQLIADIKKMLLDNLNNGITKPYHMSAIIELADGVFDDVGSFVFNIYNCKLYRQKETENIAVINQNRGKYCMDTIANLEKKLVFRYSRTTDFDFRYTVIKAPVHDENYFLSLFSEVSEVINCP
jgi:tetratricopeptide (TPR) repeat protein